MPYAWLSCSFSNKLVKGSVAKESIHMSHLTLRAHMNGIYHYTLRNVNLAGPP